MKKYKIYPTLSSESIEGWIWTNDETISKNTFITIKNQLNGKKVRTFKRSIDKNYIKGYNSSDITNNIDTVEIKIVMNEYYRNKLQLDKNEIADLKIKSSSFIERTLLNSLDHPNPYVSFSNKVTLISFLVTVLALILTILTLR